MADILPTNFPIPTESSISSYSYLDLLRNTGTLVLYGANVKDDGSSTIVYFLTSNSNYGSYLAYSSKESAGTTNGLFSADQSFDYEVQTPINIKGTGYAMIPMFITNGNGNNYLTMTLTLYHVTSGGTETSLATGTTGNSYAPSGSLSEQYQCVSMILLDLNKVFKKGEKIRFKISSVAGSGTGSPNYYIGHDPTGRGNSGSWNVIPMQIQLPVRINT